MKTILRLLVASSGALLLIAATATSAAAQATNTVTGCLNPGGQLGKIAVGAAPDKPCSLQERQVTLAGASGASPGSFYMGFDRDTEMVLAANGPVSFSLKCQLLGGTVMVAQIFASSTVGDWFGGQPPTPFSGQPPGPFAGTVPTNGFAASNLSQTFSPFLRAVEDQSVTGGGRYLALTGLVVAVNYGGRDCVVMGTIHTARLP